MSYKGTYEDKSLKHYGTKGMKWGRTKYPGKYTPIGDEAKVARQLLGSASNPNSMMSRLNNSQSTNNKKSTSARANSAARPNNQSDIYTPNNLKGHFSNSSAPLSSAARPNSSASKKFEQERERKKNQSATEQRRIAGADGTNAANLERMLRRPTPEEIERGKINSRRPINMDRFIRAAKKSSQPARDAETKRQNIRTGDSQVAETRRLMKAHPEMVSNSKEYFQRGPGGFDRRTQARANDARAVAENRRTAESKKAYYQRELEKSKKVSSARNSKSDAQNAVADAKSDAKRLIKKGRKKVRNLLRKFF